MATYRHASALIRQFVDSNGLPVSGGTITSSLTGSSTPTDMFTDSAGTSAGAIITLNSRGEPEVSGNTVQIWLDESITYRFILKSSSGSAQWTEDDISVGLSTTAAKAVQAIDVGATDSLYAHTGDFDGQQVIVASYYESGMPDGGGGSFVWDSSSTASDDLGGSTVLPTGHVSAGRWVRVVEANTVAPEMWGCVYEASPTTDYGVELQACLDAARVNGWAVQQAGRIGTARSIVLSNGTIWRGSSNNTCSVDWVGGSDLANYANAMIDFYKPNDLIFGIRVTDMSFRGGDVAGNVAHCPVAMRCVALQEGSLFQNLNLSYWKTAGLKADQGGSAGTARNHGVVFMNILSIAGPDEVAGTGYDFGGAVGGCNFINLTADQHNATTVGEYATGISLGTQSINNVFNHCQIEDCGIGVLDGGTGNTFTGLFIKNDWETGTDAFKSTGGAYSVINMRVDNVADFTNVVNDTVEGTVVVNSSSTNDVAFHTRGKVISGLAAVVSDVSTNMRRENTIDKGNWKNQRGSTGGGLHNSVAGNVTIAASGTEYVVIDMGQSGANAWFSGKLIVGGVSSANQSYNERMFSGTAVSDGTVASVSSTTQVGTATTDVQIGVAEALSSPSQGKFRIPITNLNGSASIGADVILELVTSGNAVLPVDFYFE